MKNSYKNKEEILGDELYKITITDKTGLVITQNSSKKLVINQLVSNLQFGLYYVTLTNEKGEKVTKPFIKQ